MSTTPAPTRIGSAAQRIGCVLKTSAMGAGFGAAAGALLGILWGLLFGLAHGMWWESLSAAAGLPLLCGVYFGAGGALAGILTGGCYGMIDGPSTTDTHRHCQVRTTDGSKPWGPAGDAAGAEKPLRDKKPEANRILQLVPNARGGGQWPTTTFP